MLEKILKLDSDEYKTFLIHLIYSIIDGIILGVFALNEFILIKSLRGTNYQIGFIVQSTVIVLSFSIIFNIILKSINRKKRFIRIIGILTRLPLMLFVLFPAQNYNQGNAIYYQLGFILIFLIYYMANPLLLPAINHLLKNSYSHENFGRLYGYASSSNKVMMLISTFMLGLLLDYNYSAYRFVYPITAVISIASIFILTKIKYEEEEITVIRNGFIRSVLNTIKESSKILKTNKPYRDFENAFFLYGLAWMATTAVIPIFFDKKLELNYTSVAFYKNSYNIISIILLPFFGKLIGKIDPRRFAIVTFSAMLLHVLFLALTEFFPLHFVIWDITLYYSLIASYIWYGLFGALMALLWYIGSSYFCKNSEVGNYQAIHVSLTGIRGSLAPILGIVLLNWIGYAGVFIASMVSLIGAVYIMVKSMKKYPTAIVETIKKKN